MAYERLSEVLVDFACRLVEGFAVPDILYELCDRSVQLLDVAGAGVLLRDEDGQFRLLGASSEQLRRLEIVELEVGQGPCLEAGELGDDVIEPDLAAGGTERWSAYAPRALELGVRGVYCFAMKARADTIGALNLYRARPGSLSPEDVAVGRVLADVASAYVVNARALQDSRRLAAQLQDALTSRVEIEQAKGMLAQQLGIDMETAFRLLHRYTRNHRRPLRDVAREIVSGDLPLGDVGQLDSTDERGS